MENLFPSKDISPFALTVEAALKLVNDPKRLGTDSPLAVPHLLSRVYHFQLNSPEDRGKCLCNLLKAAIIRIEGKFAETYQTILRERYFNERKEEYICDQIGLEKGAYHKHRKRAIEQLSLIVVEQTQPALQLDFPPQSRQKLQGRDADLHKCRQALQEKKAVTIIGHGGVGKTTMGSYLAHQWQQGRVFWFTIRPGFNDNIHSLLHALGFFLKSVGEPLLWQEVMALHSTNGKNMIDLDRLSPILRYSLDNLNQRNETPLLCFDELDLLQPTQSGEHKQILDLLAGHWNEVPLLLIGQQSLLDPQPFCILQDLSMSQTTRMLNEAGIRLTGSESKQLYSYTQGNPRLIELFISIFDTNEPFSVLFEQMVTAPPLEFFLSRLVQRMHADECLLLIKFAVLRNDVSSSLLSTDSQGMAFQQFRQRRLLIQNDAGGVALLPAYRTILYKTLPEDKRVVAHQWAAMKYAAIAAYTEAAYHLVQSGEIELAIALWHKHQHQEINQGQAVVAYQLFQSFDSSGCDRVAHETHQLITATLARLIGNPQQALHDLRSVLWQTPILAMEAQNLQGIIANDQGEFTNAKNYLKQALYQVEGLMETRLTYIHKGLAWAYRAEFDMESAWRETQYARYECEIIQGLIQEDLANYTVAREHYGAALELATLLHYKEGIAKTANSLSILLGKLGEFDSAYDSSTLAYQNYEAIGKVHSLSIAQFNLAFNYTLAGKYEQSVAALSSVFKIAERYQFSLSPRLVAFTHLTMAEALVGMQNLEMAEQHLRNAMDAEYDELLTDCFRVLGEIHCARSQFYDAIHVLRQAIQHQAQMNYPDLFTTAYSWRSLAKAFQLSNQVEQADEAKKQAITMFTKMGLQHEVEKTITLFNNLTSHK